MKLTLWKVIPVLEMCIQQWKIMMDEPKFERVKHRLEAGIETMMKYYRRVENGIIYFAAMGSSSLFLTFIFQDLLNDADSS
jgi:hypothetical protein